MNTQTIKLSVLEYALIKSTGISTVHRKIDKKKLKATIDIPPAYTKQQTKYLIHVDVSPETAYKVKTILTDLRSIKL